MKAIILVILSLIITNFTKAQIDSSYISTQIDVDVNTIDFKQGKTIIENYIQSNQLKIQTQNVGKNSLNVRLILNETQYTNFEKVLPSLGYITSKKVNTVNNFNKVREIQLEIDYLKQNKATYEDILKKANEGSDRYFNLWNEKKRLEDQIFAKQKELLNFEFTQNAYVLNLELLEESTSPESSRVTFVNMPGLEYSFLTINSPMPGISNNQYQGYFLKYLFTKGKSYATAGAYKSLNAPKSDTTMFSELFVLGFGQDFYTRHLGRGSRKFFNLYSGYSVGDIFATSKVSKSNFLYLAPSIGVEIFKNKYFLLDTKVNYFIPLSYNRNLRGLSYNVSFNFVF